MLPDILREHEQGRLRRLVCHIDDPPVGAASIRAAQENRPVGRQLERGRGSRHGRDDDGRRGPSVRPHSKFIYESDIDVRECGDEGLRAALRAVEQVDGVDSQLPQGIDRRPRRAARA